MLVTLCETEQTVVGADHGNAQPDDERTGYEEVAHRKEQRAQFLGPIDQEACDPDGKGNEPQRADDARQASQAGVADDDFVKTEDEEEAGDRKLEIILSVLSAIPEEETKNINLIDVSSNNNIYFIYKERVVMRFGDSTDIEPRIDLGFRSLAVEQGIDPSVTGIITSTIPKEASFNPQDVEDIKELVIYNGGEWEEPENPFVSDTPEEETEENEE